MILEKSSLTHPGIWHLERSLIGAFLLVSSPTKIDSFYYLLLVLVFLQFFGCSSHSFSYPLPPRRLFILPRLAILEMTSIESLLNPVPEIRSYQLSRSTDTATFRAPRQKRQRIAKDAPIYHKGEIRGELRYPPCEERDEELTRIHGEFKIHPLGNIADFPRHIPYNSDKKSFQERTGREFFEGIYSLHYPLD